MIIEIIKGAFQVFDNYYLGTMHLADFHEHLIHYPFS